jgi:hypothetical protein
VLGLKLEQRAPLHSLTQVQCGKFNAHTTSILDPTSRHAAAGAALAEHASKRNDSQGIARQSLIVELSCDASL